MRIPVNQISEDGWKRTLEIPLASLTRLVEVHGPQAGTLKAQVTLKNHRGVIGVRGTLEAAISLGCHLCLDTGAVEVEAPLDLMVAPEQSLSPGQTDQAHPEVQLAASDLDVAFYDGEELDLTQILEDELLIATPDSIGEEDEDGKCLRCGRDVDTVLNPEGSADAADTFHPFRELADRIKNAEQTSETTPSRDRKD